ncbi:hypothetical protein MTTB_p270 (plasmid) [Methanothermobacter tenebrarum]|uniref:DNA methylase adenine-specific domain-containing protein n=2 Tax=Methanothermobacter tenebrarum TaxID=680118 RepID=A0ABM7YFU6_9EURY|nr:hypothetical protein MTTB_p270 [Methanothermobacter tenebrarum]
MHYHNRPFFPPKSPLLSFFIIKSNNLTCLALININYRSSITFMWDIMKLPRIEERTLYSPIIDCLHELGFEAVGETKVGKKHPDILFTYDETSFVIEVKIGKPEIGLNAVAQAHDYAKKLGTQNNIIILIYPENYRNQVILDESIVRRIALEEEIHTLVLTEYWTESLVTEPIRLFESLKDKIINKKRKVDFNTVVNLIKTYVKDLGDIIYQIETDQLVPEVVDKLDLFSSIGEIKDKRKAEKQVKVLASYLLFNQLLFYHIFKRKAQNKLLPELEKIKNVQELQSYFDHITSINYKSIYNVNILGHIPNEKPVIDTLNELIEAIKLLRAEHITHDLAGRFFHDLIPQEVRKILAAFYTHPIAAEILAGLTMNSWDEKVIDPACGSGTLLVSAYKRKQKLYQQLYGYKDHDKIHRRFLEEDLTGIDIMPFAAHITTINLAAQNIKQETNVVRVVTQDSLELAEKLRRGEFKDRGIRFSPYTVTVQQTLFGASNQKESKGTVSPEGKGEKFHLKPVDVVIMNPPFSDREKMPRYMLEKLKNNDTLGGICGHKVNLWGYFIALADYLLKPGGRIGAVIPINIFRGEATEKIRKYLIENYKIEYIIKPEKNIAFSEDADFRDILLVARKEKPSREDKVRFVILNEDIHSLSLQDAAKIVKHIKGSLVSENRLDIVDYEYALIRENINNLMPLFGPTSTRTGQILSNFLSIIKKHAGHLLRNLKKSEIREGFKPPFAGLSEMAFINNPSFGENRIKRAFLILEEDNRESVRFYIKKWPNRIFKIGKSKLKPALRTLTDIKTFNIPDNADYIITDKFKDYKTVLKLSKFKDKENFTYDIVRERIKGKWTYMVTARRFRPNSKNTYFFAFSSNKRIIAPDTFKCILLEKESAKINTLYLNSIMGITSLVLLREQTTEGYIDIREKDLVLFDIIDVNLLDREQKAELLRLYDELKGCEFPSLLDQFKDRFWGRTKLDKRLLEILGVPEDVIEEWLPKVYDAIVGELSHD